MINHLRTRPLAPRRYRLTRNLSGTLTPRIGVDDPALSTWLFIVPIEAPCHAVRLGFANPYGFTQTIVKASVYPSDSYSDAATALTTPGTAVKPTGGAPGTRIGWELGNGFDVAAINSRANVRTHILPGVASNRDNAAGPYTIAWSDFCPCTSIPRADGSATPLLFIYVTLGGTDFVGGPTGILAFNQDPTAARGRCFYGLRASTLGKDFADHPEGSRWSPLGEPPFCPALWVQYLTMTPGYQIVQIGDSLSSGPSNDGCSASVWRAAADLSSPRLPIEFCNMAWAGTGTAVYDVLLTNNAASLRPSVVTAQPISRNDGFTTASIEMLIARKLALLDALSSYGTELIWNIPACSSLNGNAQQIEIFKAMRHNLLAAGCTAGTPVIDAPAIIGHLAADAPWDYAPGYSDDNLHPNTAGVEAVVAAATAALRQLGGLP
ncbi:SGNH/GDSL hydrolase family protein [Acidisphaera sp. S103]|uniref:SGNH/GDSL hydrolase family protein n=1 Tax=Acidisphaera sp. S103 TaxID=1747223 RepID=UPI00131BDC74|nr:SGNH/GDSL hydrolase family protein [Acidisphaera sp. S103]